MLDALIEFLTAPLITALLALADDSVLPDVEGDLGEAYDAWDAWMGGQLAARSAFVEEIRRLTDRESSFCEDCERPAWDDDIRGVRGDHYVCEPCFDEWYRHCDGCSEYAYADDMTYVSGLDYCESCRSNYCWYCDNCDEWYHEDDGHDHDNENCECEAPHPGFKFPADGHGTIEENERLTVELAKGTIDEEGIHRIKRLLWPAANDNWNIVETTVNGVGNIWQTRRGNFTRRLSSAFHKHGIKLAPGVISEIGNVAREHSGDASSWHVELTRDLNGSPEEFAHGDSCWWQSYSYSRCALKNWGGIGLRSFADDTAGFFPGDVTGRAWVQPLDVDLRPTHDTENARAYLVFNGYGDLKGYTAARIVAHLTSRTYRKVTYGADRQYVNGESGYLVADEATCEATERLFFHNDEHHQFDAHTFNEEAVA